MIELSGRTVRPGPRRLLGPLVVLAASFAAFAGVAGWPFAAEIQTPPAGKGAPIRIKPSAKTLPGGRPVVQVNPRFVIEPAEIDPRFVVPQSAEIDPKFVIARSAEIDPRIIAFKPGASIRR